MGACGNADTAPACLPHCWLCRCFGHHVTKIDSCAICGITREVVGFAHMCSTGDGLGELFAIPVLPSVQGVVIGWRLLTESIRDFGYDRA
jgi:N-acetylglutamate synthase-like GNAT family acetyltransferase